MTIKPVAWTEPNELARVIDDEVGSMWGGKESDDQIALCLHSEAANGIELIAASRDAYAEQRDELQRLHDETMAEITRLTEENKRLRDALSKLLQRDQRNTCQHGNTHCGGFIWEICDDCGAKWADDCGGKPEWKDPQEWVDAEVILAVKHD